MSQAERTSEGWVLIVDDQPDVCWVLTRLLADRGHAVRSAQTGAAALSLAAALDVRVAVVDYRLPDADGLTLARSLRGLRPELRAILMTSYGNAQLRRRVVEEGLIGYFDKPFNNDAMIRAVEAALRDAAGETGSPV